METQATWQVFCFFFLIFIFSLWIYTKTLAVYKMLSGELQCYLIHTDRRRSEDHRTMCHERETLLKFNYFQFLERCHSWHFVTDLLARYSWLQKWKYTCEKELWKYYFQRLGIGFAGYYFTPKSKVNWVVTLYSASRGANLLFIGPDY